MTELFNTIIMFCKKHFYPENFISITCGVITLFIFIFFLHKQRKREQQMFWNDRNLLLDIMTDDYISRPQGYGRIVLDSLLKQPITNRKELDKVTFMYNNGEFRTQQEIAEYDFYENHSRYNKSRHIINTAMFIIPFFATIVPLWTVLYDKFYVVGIPIALLISLLISYVFMMIGYAINCSNAKMYNLPSDAPAVNAERNKLKIGAISGAISAFSIGRHAKKAVKDVTNVDSWKEFK